MGRPLLFIWIGACNYPCIAKTVLCNRAAAGVIRFGMRLQGRKYSAAFRQFRHCVQRLLLCIHMNHQLYLRMYFCALEGISRRHTGIAKRKLRVHDLPNLLRSPAGRILRPAGQMINLAAKRLYIAGDRLFAVSSERQVGNNLYLPFFQFFFSLPNKIFRFESVPFGPLYVKVHFVFCILSFVHIRCCLFR